MFSNLSLCLEPVCTSIYPYCCNSIDLERSDEPMIWQLDVADELVSLGFCLVF